MNLQITKKNVKISTSTKESDMLILSEKEQDNVSAFLEVTMDNSSTKQFVSEEYGIEKLNENNAVLPGKISDVSMQNIHKLSDELKTKQQYKEGIEVMSAKDYHQSKKISQKSKQIGLKLDTVNRRKYNLSEKKSHEKHTNEKNVSFGLHCVQSQGGIQTKLIEPASYDETVLINNCQSSNEIIKKLEVYPLLYGDLQPPEKCKPIKKTKLDICDDFDFDDLCLNLCQYQDKSLAQLRPKTSESNHSISNSMNDHIKIVEVVSFQENSTTSGTVDVYGPISKLNDEQKFVNCNIHMCCAEESNVHTPNNAVGNKAPKPSYIKHPCKPDNKIVQFESEHNKLYSCHMNERLVTEHPGTGKPKYDCSLETHDESTVKNKPVSCSEKIKLRSVCADPSDSISPFVETYLLEMINRELIHQVFGKQLLIKRSVGIHNN